jgi:hypothetical protein
MDCSVAGSHVSHVALTCAAAAIQNKNITSGRDHRICSTR